MSSAFLYLAIVAIWAFVLVPRWLRRPHAAVQSEGGDGLGDSAASADDSHPEQWEESDSCPAARVGPGLAATLSRSRALQARRRLLTMLVLLTAAAGACVVLKLTPWWACVPPAGMLGIYLLLLREAALADAEQARRRAAMELRVQAARQRAQAASMARQAQHSAEIIDISARIGDQLYDQYADATVRAVGD